MIPMRPILPILLAAAVLCVSAREEAGGTAFRIPRPNPVLKFPADHGSHPEFRIEWWYVTGHLFSGERRFGLQATFFRFAERPGPAPEGAFSGGQFHLAHMAVSEPGKKSFLHEERVNREGWDAFAKTDDLDVHNGNWRLKRVDDPEHGDRFLLDGSVLSDARFKLRLVPEKPHVLFGRDGVSRKGADPGEASLYITFTRLKVEGMLRIGGEDLVVAGQAWMDHEISSSQLGDDLAGWDWVSIQLKDGRELMAYILRRKDGSPGPWSTLAWIDRAGEVSHVPADKFTWKPGGKWMSPETGADYPIRPRIEVVDPKSGKPCVFQVRPLMAAQEITGEIGGIAYWEGACDILDAAGKIIGSGFLEQTGYADDDLEQRLR